MKNIIIFLWFFSVFVQANPTVEWDVANAEPIEDVKVRLANINVQDIKEFTEVFIDQKIEKNSIQSLHRIRRAYYFPDVNAVQNYGTDYIGFNSELDQLKIFRIVSVTAAGMVHEFNRNDLKINDTNSSNVFSSTKNAVFTYPGLEAGGFAIVEFMIARDLRRQESDWFKEFYPQNLYPRQNYTLTATWNKASPIQYVNSSDHVNCEQNENEVRCSGENIPKVDSDVNVFWGDQLGSIKFGEVLSWSQISARTLARFDKSQQVDQKIIKAFVNELLANESSIVKKISLIHEFVGQKVQYVSLSENGNSYTPHSVLRTLHKRMGDCKDKTALFYSMLKAIGVDAFPVLVATDRRKVSNMQLPSMTYFDHMIICFHSPDGKRGCSDPTNYHSDWRYMSPYIQGRAALPLSVEAAPINLPVNKYRWFAKIKTELLFLKDGGQSERQTRQYINEYANYWRGFLLQKNEIERDQWLINDYKEFVASKANVRFSVEGLHDVSQDIVIKSESTHPPLVDTGVELDYAETDAWVSSELSDIKISNKVYEYSVSGLHLISESVWDVSQVWAIKILPAEIQLKHEFGSMFRRIKKLDAGRVQITTEVLIPQTLIAAKDIERFNSFVDILKRESSIRLYGSLKQS